MRKVLAGVVLVAAGLYAPQAAAQCTAFLDEGFLDASFLSSGFIEEAGCVAVPDVRGLSEAAADTALEAVALDTGSVLARCSIQATGEVIDQAPPADTIVEEGALVDLFTSTGVECEGARSRLRLNLEIKP